MSDIRKIYAEIELDDTKAVKNNLSSVEYLEKVFEQRNEKGIVLKETFIADDDEDDPYAAYINYVAEWCFSPHEEDVMQNGVLSYYDWVKGYYKTLSAKYGIQMDSPLGAAYNLIATIGNAPDTSLGNRSAPFHPFYRDNKGVMLCVALEEKKVGLRPEEWYYSLFVTDNENSLGEYYRTNSLSEDELGDLLKEIFAGIETRTFFRTKHANEKSVFSMIGFLLQNDEMLCDGHGKVMKFHTLQEGYAWMKKNGLKEKECNQAKPIYMTGT